MNWDLAIGAAYFLGLLALLVGSAWLPRAWYLPGGVAVLALFVYGMDWALDGADGPGGFGVVALHGAMLALGAFSHALRWLRAAWRWWRPRQHAK